MSAHPGDQRNEGVAARVADDVGVGVGEGPKDDTNALLPVTLDRLLVVDWVAPRDGVAIEGLLFVYDAPTLTEEQINAISLPVDELEQWAWCNDRQLRERPPAHMLRRITAARHARTDGATRYLENVSISS